MRNINRMTDKLHRFCITLDVYPDVFRAALPIDSDFLCEIAVYRIRSPGAAFGAEDVLLAALGVLLHRI